MGNIEHGNRPKSEGIEQKVAANSPEQSAKPRELTAADFRAAVTETDKKISSGEKSIADTQSQLHEVRASMDLPDSDEAPHSIKVTQERNASLQEQKSATETQLAKHDDQEKQAQPENTEMDEEQKLTNELYDLDDKEKEIGKEFHAKVADMEAKKGGKLTEDERGQLSEQMFGAVRMQIRGKERKLERLREERSRRPQSQAAEKPNEKQAENSEIKEDKETSLDEKIHGVLKRYDYSRPLNQFYYELNNREDRRLNQLVSPELISNLKSATGELENLLEQKNVTKEQLNMALYGIAKVFEHMLETPYASGINDDSESLRQIGYNLRAVGEMNYEVATKIGSMDESKDQSDTQAMRTLFRQWNEIINEKITEVSRKAEALENFR